MSQTWIGFAIIAVMALVIWVAVAKAKCQQKRRGTKVRAFMADVEKSRILPTVASNVLLKSGENAFYSAPSALYETK